MKKLYILLVFILLLATILAQNPFAKYGYDVPLATSSKGEFEEFHGLSDVVEIGSIRYNTLTKEIVGYLEEEKTESEVSVITTAMSVDPHCERYYWISPYAYCFNNPVNVIDPDGRDGIYITYPDYMVDTETKLGKQPLGHSGVLLIDNKTGLTKYYEYGRYSTEDGTKGRVRNVKVPDVIMGENGMPTTESLNNVLSDISEKAGLNGKIEGAYIKSDKFDEMNNYAQGKLNESTVGKKGYNKDRESYSLTGNNCATFAADVLQQDSKVKSPNTLINTPTNISGSYRKRYDNVDYNSSTGTTITPTKTITQKVKDFFGF